MLGPFDCLTADIWDVDSSSKYFRPGGYVDSITFPLLQLMQVHLESEINSSPPFQLSTPALPALKQAGISKRLNLPTDTPSRPRTPSLPKESNTHAAKYTSELPPLPRAFKENSQHTETLSSQQKSDTTYYTALWGSPYELPSGSGDSKRRKPLKNRRNSVSTTDGSPLRDRSSGLKESFDLRNRRFVKRSNTSDATSQFTSEPVDHRPRDSRYDLTGEWIRKYHHAKAEKKTWFSDEEDSETESEDDTEEDSVERGSEDWVELDPRTPRVRQRTSVDPEGSPTSPLAHISKVRSGHTRNNATLTQEEFDNIVKHSSPNESKGAKMLSAWMSGATMPHPDRRSSKSNSISEKPLPTAPAPLSRSISESPAITHQAASADRPPQTKRPSVSKMASFQRPKKKVIWRGKQCTIALPLEEPRDHNGRLKVPLQPQQLEGLLADWKRMGYAIRGFDLNEPSVQEDLRGQSCGIYPDLPDFQDEIQSRRFRVKIPNQQSWNDEVKQRQEEILRALGVTIGDEESPVKNPPSVPQMSRQTSSHNSLPQSRPNLPFSASGLRSPLDNATQPPMTAPHSQFPFPQPMVSPNMIQQNPRSAGFHIPHQSVAFSRDQVFSPGLPFPSQPTPPIAGSRGPQQYLGSLPSSRGVSPLIDGRRQSIRATHSPVSPLPKMLDGYFNGQLQLPPNLRQIPGQMNQGPVQSQQSRPLHLSLQQQVSESLRKQREVRYISHPEIASPLPQGKNHRHNVSESLQKEIDDAEYHLEESIARQFEASSKSPVKNDSNLSKRPEVITEESAKEEQKTAASDIETNPSLANSPRLGSGRPTPLHSAKPSTSKFNVKAQEFVYNPAKPPFAPIFTFGEKSPMSGPPSAASTGFNAAHSKNTSNASTFSSGLNVSAPAFVPAKSSVPSSSNRVFSFSSTAPSFKPDAPTFTPGFAFSAMTTDGADKKDQAPKMFNYADMIQPPKKSRAIPIVKPQDDEEVEEDEEDEEGRIIQAKGHQKRMRRTGGSGDQEALFATPTADITVPSNLGPSTSSQVDIKDTEVDNVEPMEKTPDAEQPSDVPIQARGDTSRGSSLSIEQPLNTADFLEAPTNPASPVEKATDELQSMVDGIAAVEPSGPLDKAEVQGSIDDPFTVGDHEDEITSERSRAHTPTSPESSVSRLEPENTIKQPEDSNDDHASKSTQESTSESMAPRKSTLSAAAKPFIFNPVVASFKSDAEMETAVPATASMQPVGAVLDKQTLNEVMESKSEKEPAKASVSKPSILGGGLGASRYAIEEPSQPMSSVTKPSKPYMTEPLASLPEPAIADSTESAPVLEKEEHFSTPELSPKANGFIERSGDLTSDLSMKERILNGVSYIEPTTYKELDDVMKVLNGDDSDIGVERNPAAVWRSPAKLVKEERPLVDVARSDYISDEERQLKPTPPRLPTSSPNQLDRPFQYLPERDYNSTDSARADAEAEIVARNARFSPSYKGPRNPSLRDSPVRRLNRSDDSISAWDDVVSSGEEADFNTRVGFFNNRVGQVITSAVDSRIQPLEASLAALTASLTRMGERSHSRRFQRRSSVESDADDEDDDNSPARGTSPFVKDRRFEKLKAMLLETMNAHKQSHNDNLMKVLENVGELKTAFAQQREEPSTPSRNPDRGTISQTQDSLAADLESSSGQPLSTAAAPSVSSEELTNVKKALSDLQAFMQQKQPSEAVTANENIKALIEDAFKKHMKNKPVPSKAEDSAIATVERLKLQIGGLESMLKTAEDRATEEYKLRRGVEDKLAERERELKLAVAEAAEHRDAAEETEQSLRSFVDDQQQAKQHTAMLEDFKDALEKNIADLTDKNSALEETIAEYRISHDDWRDEIDTAKTENEELQQTISSLREELEEDIAAKHSLREKLERMQEDMTEATRNIARDQASWRHKDEEHKAKHDLSAARLEAEARTRERLELEIERLEKQEREAMKARTLVEDIRSQNSNLTNMVNELRSTSHGYQEKSMALERELHDTKERGRLEIHRIMAATKGDVEAAKQQVDILRASLESVITRLENQLQDAKSDAATQKERYELLLEEASVSRDNALREAAEARDAALQEHYRFHERTLHETRVSHERAINDLKATHTRAFATADEDHSRIVSNLIEDHRRELHTTAQEKRIMEQELHGRLSLADDKIDHLQEKVKHLEGRLDIAKSAAQAAADAARSTRTSLPPPVSHGSMPATRGSETPVKISPQALRESILVLQEQLGEREARIEKLEQDFSKVDTEAPNKLKERDIEVAWLRELLGVRLDDLQDIIIALASPNFDRSAVRDAVIRLRANLQMEQQEKERASSGGQKLSLSALTSSPRALPLAAAAAWGNWRKGQTSLGSLAEMAVPSANSSANQTPSKSSPHSFLSGL